jgi:murein L,D-transpeptidase YafK
VLVGLKQERLLEVWVSQESGPKLLKTYPILAASGKAGPKLRENDMQVPEGIYEIESLHPNSAFHVALRVGYPNSFEKAKARIDNRNELGSDIMIHGSRASIGCVAMGDEAAEELFVLAADVGIKNVELVLCPVDFRVRELPQDTPGLPDWAPELYALIKQELAKLRETGR